MNEQAEGPQSGVRANHGDLAPEKSDWLVMACIYAAALAIHVLMTLNTTIFNLTPDEYSVTAIAAYFNGMNWEPTVSPGGYYGYFQSLFYVPVYWITDDPLLRYRLMLVINGILMSFVPVIVYYICRKVFGVNTPASVLFTVICGFYPCCMLLTKYTWNETMCNLLPWVFVLIIYKSLGCADKIKKQIFSVLGGLILAAAYASHGRMLALVAAGIVLELVVYFTMKRKKIFCFTGFFAGAAVGYVVDKLIKGHLQSVLWNVGEGRNAPVNTIEKMLSQLFGANGSFSFEKFFKTLLGHFFYFLSSTWGFGAVCVILIITALVMYFRRGTKAAAAADNGSGNAGSAGNSEAAEIRKPYADDNTMVLAWLSLLSMGAIFMVSVLFKCTSAQYGKRLDTLIYGRYTETFYPISILCGLLLIYKGRLSEAQSFGAVVITSLTFALTQLFVVPVVVSSETLVSAMILGLSPMRYGEAVKDMYTNATFYKIFATIIVMVIIWAIIGVLRQKDRSKYLYFSLPLASLLIYTSVFGYFGYVTPQGTVSLNAAKTMTAAVDKLDGDFDSVTLFNIVRDKYVKTQFFYPTMRVQIAQNLSAYDRLENKTDIVLSNKEDAPELFIDGLRLIGSAGGNVHVYAATDKACEWARENNFRLGESGIASYSAAELPATTGAVRAGHDENADLDYVNERESAVTLSLPNGAAVYTNYTNLLKAGTYVFTVYGSGLDGSRLSVTSDKGAETLSYEVMEENGDVVRAAVSISKKTENVRFKLTNVKDSQITVSGLDVRLLN